MQAKHLNAFLEATRDTFSTMIGLEFKRCGRLRKAEGEIVDCDDLMAVLGLTGDVKGALMMSAPLEVAQAIVGKFLYEEIEAINCDLMDGWGELVNIIAGAADALLQDVSINLALPSVLIGNRSKFFAKAGCPFIIVPMKIEEVGTFNIGLSLEVTADKKI